MLSTSGACAERPIVEVSCFKLHLVSFTIDMGVAYHYTSAIHMLFHFSAPNPASSTPEGSAPMFMRTASIENLVRNHRTSE